MLAKESLEEKSTATEIHSLGGQVATSEPSAAGGTACKVHRAPVFEKTVQDKLKLC